MSKSHHTNRGSRGRYAVLAEENPIARAYLKAMATATDSQILEFGLRFFPESVLRDDVPLTADELRAALAQQIDIDLLSRVPTWLDAAAAERVARRKNIFITEVRRRNDLAIEKRRAAQGSRFPNLIKSEAVSNISLGATERHDGECSSEGEIEP